MKTEKAQVSQVTYDDFPDHSEVRIATMTEWANGEGMDISINRKHMHDIMVSLTYDDMSLFRKMFSDFDMR